MPSFTLVNQVTIPDTDARTWLYAIPDGDPTGTGLPLVLTVEAPSLTRAGVSAVYAVRADPFAASLSGLGWVELAPVGFHPRASVRDHAHIFNRGRHWVSRSFEDKGLSVCTFQPSLVDVTAPPGSGFPLFGPTGFPGRAQLNTGWSTNDHCMSPAGDGVWVSALDGTYSAQRFARVDANMRTRMSPRMVPRVGDPADPVWNTASARPIRGQPGARAHVVAPTSLHYNKTSDLRVLEADFSTGLWTDTQRITWGSSNQLQMGTRVALPGGAVAITYKRLSTSWRTATDQDDSGDIVRSLYDAAGTWLDNEVMVDSQGSSWTTSGNRPHTQLLRYRGDTYLLTSWDQWDLSTSGGTRTTGNGSPSGCVLRVEQWVP